MSFKEKIEALIEKMLQPILTEHNYELVDVEYVKEAGNWYLRIFIDKEGGVTIDDCEILSKALDVQLETNDPITEPYILEVSSPGLDRALKKDKDFTRSMGKTVELKLYKPLNNQKEFEGQLVSFNEDTVTLEMDEESMTFNRKDIAIIRLVVIF